MESDRSLLWSIKFGRFQHLQAQDEKVYVTKLPLPGQIALLRLKSLSLLSMFISLTC